MIHEIESKVGKMTHCFIKKKFTNLLQFGARDYFCLSWYLALYRNTEKIHFSLTSMTSVAVVKMLVMMFVEVFIEITPPPPSPYQ